MWSVFGNISQSISRFNALVRMTVVIGKNVLKIRGRPLSVMAHLKKSILEVKAEANCLAQALVIAIAKVKKRS